MVFVFLLKTFKHFSGHSQFLAYISLFFQSHRSCFQSRGIFFGICNLFFATRGLFFSLSAFGFKRENELFWCFGVRCCGRASLFEKFSELKYQLSRLLWQLLPFPMIFFKQKSPEPFRFRAFWEFIFSAEINRAGNRE